MQTSAFKAQTSQGLLSLRDTDRASSEMNRPEFGSYQRARLWSLIASCERHGVDPQRYLTSVLAKIGITASEELNQFLPDVWKREDAAEPLAEG